MKRIVVCMDGTWQSLNQDKLTNIGVIARSIAHKETIKDERGGDHHINQMVIYTHGVGASIGALAQRGVVDNFNAGVSRLFGGAFGVGLEDGIVDTYLRLAFNFEAGDEIYIFGFSRGAFAARRLAGFINSAGIVSRRFAEKAVMGFQLYNDKPKDDASDTEKAEHEREELQFRRLYGKGDRNEDGTRRSVDAPPPITYLGVFDTVVQRGVGEVLASFSPVVSKRYKLQNLRICPNVLAARHAVAIDECRLGFPSTRWEELEESNKIARARAGADPQRTYYEQRWFTGMHGDVGGGVGSKLSAIALKWIAEGAARQGLRFYATYGSDISPLNEALRDENLSFSAPISRTPMSEAWEPMNLPFRARKIWKQKARPTLEETESMFDPSVMERFMDAGLRYRPEPLRPFRSVWKDYAKGMQTAQSPEPPSNLPS